MFTKEIVKNKGEIKMLKNKRIVIAIIIVAIVIACAIIGVLLLKNTEKREIVYINPHERRYK